MWSKTIQSTIVVFVLSVLCAGLTFAQEKTVNGTVTDGVTGEPLPGANVSIQGTQTGTTTDANGSYELTVPGPDAVLRFSFIGYQTEEVEVGDQTVIDVVLQEEVGQLEEVVVTGYGTQQRQEVTGSVSSVDVAEASAGSNSSAQDLLQGRLAGVNVVSNSGEPGAGMRVRVRGAQSISAGNDPLYVIDGVPINNTNMTPGGANAGGVSSSSDTNPLAMLNPQDIESIEVLKDASATAIYGSQGSNGVVLIETKSGSAGGGVQVDYTGTVTAGVPAKTLDLLGADEYRQAVNDINGTPISDQPEASTDWQEQITRSTTSQEHNLSFSGGNEQTSYRASLGYSNQKGLLLDSGFKRVSGRVNADHSVLDDWLRFNLNLTATTMERNHAFYNQAGGFRGGSIKGALAFDPRRPVRNDDDSYFEYLQSIRNPVGLLEQITDNTDQERILGNFSAEADLLQNLTLKGTFGADVSNGIRRSYVPRENAVGATVDGEASQNERRLTNLVAQSTLRYNRDLLDGDHSLRLLGGFEFKQETFKQVGTTVQSFITDATLYNNLGSGTNILTPYSDKQRVTQVSVFGRANYNIQDKYFLEATLRRDGSSVFGEENKFALFPSASVGWNMAQESFLDVENLSQLKLRVSAGITGNQGVPPYESLALLSPSAGDAGIFGQEEEVIGVTQVRAASPGLKWEEAREVNVGIDYTYGRFDGSVEYYRRLTEDLLLNTNTQQPAPSETVLDNVGSVFNQGVEASLEAYVIDREDLGFTIGANASSNYNEVEDLGGRGTIDHGAVSGQGLSEVQSQRLAPGHPIGSFYGPKFVRVNDDGEEVYEAEDGTTTDEAEATKQFIGNVVPDISYGFSLRFRYQGFDANAFFRGEQGRELFNNTAAELTTKSLIGRLNVFEEALNDGTDPDSHAPAYSSRWVEDASFLRLDKLTLGYNLPNPSRFSLRRARVYVSAQNLFVLTPYSGYDPELNTNVSGEGLGFRTLSTPSRGIDYTSYPRQRTFTLGVEVGI